MRAVAVSLPRRDLPPPAHNFICASSGPSRQSRLARMGDGSGMMSPCGIWSRPVTSSRQRRHRRDGNQRVAAMLAPCWMQSAPYKYCRCTSPYIMHMYHDIRYVTRRGRRPCPRPPPRMAMGRVMYAPSCPIAGRIDPAGCRCSARGLARLGHACRRACRPFVLHPIQPGLHTEPSVVVLPPLSCVRGAAAPAFQLGDELHGNRVSCHAQLTASFCPQASG
jgi:hypothetical protein